MEYRFALPRSLARTSCSNGASGADRANLKERDENVRFKQSMTPHVSREGLVPWKLEANGNASRLNPMVGFVCGFGSCGDLLIEHPQTARTGTPRGPCLPGHSREAVGPVMAVAREAADAQAFRPSPSSAAPVTLSEFNIKRLAMTDGAAPSRHPINGTPE